MNWKKYTVIFIISIIALIAIYDVIAIVNGGTEASISHTIIIWSYHYPAFTFAMGFVMGHLFWPITPTKEFIKIHEDRKGQ